MTGPRRTSRELVVAAAPFLAAFALRLAVGLLLPHGGHGTVRGFGFYGEMADNYLADHGLGWWFYEELGFKQANRGPLFPLVLAAMRAIAGGSVRALEIGVQAAIGAAAIAVPALLARRWGGVRAGRAALWIGALWPYWVVTDTAMVEHVLYAPLCGLTAWAWVAAGDGGPRADRWAVRAGGLAGLATLARLTFFATIPFLALAGVRRLGVRRTLLTFLGVAVFVTPWVVRNIAVVGHAVIGTDGGRALLVGNHGATFTHYPRESVDRGEIEMYRQMDPAVLAELRALAKDEVAQDARFRELALANIAAEPAAVLGRMVRKAAALWSPVYNPGPTPGFLGAARLAIFAATFLPLVAAACAGAAVCARIRADLPTMLALLASFTLVAAVFWGQPRYLAPLHGIGIAAAAAWLARRPEARP